MLVREEAKEEVVKWVWPRPIAFDEFLDLFGKNDYVELVNGVAVEKTMVQLDHEKLLSWLLRLLGDYVEDRNLGIVLGSRTAVKIGPFNGRLPDLVFVRRERMDIVQQKAIYGAPDLVIEIVSPNDRPSDLIALETDYRSIGVVEILFIDPQKRLVRLLRKQDTDYTREELTAGALALETVEDLTLDLEWLLTEPRPTVRAVLDRL
jgi:Uma2 family endonuclease